MKIYRIDKSLLKWREVPQINYPWNLPIFVNEDMEVVAGNFLKDALPDKIMFFIIKNQFKGAIEAISYLEDLIIEENNLGRINELYVLLRKYLYNIKYPEEFVPLFDYKETDILTEDNYKKPNFAFNKKEKVKIELCYLIETEEQKSDDIVIDMEILKELL